MYARVAFPAALPEALSYRVPETLELLVQPGVRVRVRLRSRMRVGLVVERTETPDCPPERVLPVDEVLDAEPFVPGHVLELIRFAAEYYATPVGVVVRAAIPAALLRVPPPIVALGPRAREVLIGADREHARLLERLLVAHRLSLARLCSEGFSRAELDEVLPALVAAGALRVIERTAGSASTATVTAVVLSELAPEERLRRLGRAPAQERVVNWLADLARPVLESEVIAACGCSAGVVAQLEKKGLVHRFKQARVTAARRWELAPPAPPKTLSAEQASALGTLEEAVAARSFSSFLLRGVTGSGKTEVYVRAAQRAVALGLQVIVLVPEIGLTPALAGQLGARFSGRVAILHSSMAEGERTSAWERARRGAVDVVAGPRSALWAPLSKLGLIVIDEEQDTSYKQGEEPRYHARDLGLVLGQRCNAPVVLVSATPSLEALHLVSQDRLRVLALASRVGGGRLPAVAVVDMRGEKPEPGEHGQRWLSVRLLGAIADVQARGEQAILLVNRRGWAPVLLCRQCGHQARCAQCSIPMTVHRRESSLLCHYCGHRRSIPGRCEQCAGEVLDYVGAGTEKIAELVRRDFPAARIDILDRDTARSSAQLLATLERFASGQTNVLVGTQMVSKGHHFPSVTLTGVISADNLLGFPDFRGAERTFQMLTQVAGRSGRGPRRGEVVIQTYHPDHHAIRAAVAQDSDRFVQEEMRYRRAFRYPPLTRLVLVRFESASERAAVGAAEAAARAIDAGLGELRVVGPALAPIARLRGRWRVQLLLFASSRAPLRSVVGVVASLPLPPQVHRVIDVDPQSTV